MKVSGEAKLQSSAEALWAAFEDPAVLVATIPGCQRLEQTGQDAYRMTVSAGVAAIRGTYEGEVELVDKVAPRCLTMRASGSGGPGTIQVTVGVEIDPQEAGAVIRYDADVVVGGMIGGVSQRMLASVGKRLAAEFFAAVDSYIASGGAQPAAAQPAGTDAAATPSGAVASAAAPAGGAPGVFERPAATGADRAGSVDDFTKGVAVGGVLVLLGVVVGGLIARKGR
jgi:carbon monoxide dehydrogenase subunit G